MGPFPPDAPLRSAGGTDRDGPGVRNRLTGYVGSPRAEGPAGGKVPAAGAQRRSEVRGLVERHRRHGSVGVKSWVS